MKVLYILLFLLSANCYAQTPSLCIADSVMVRRYSDDARYLALKRLYQLRSADTQQIEIPQVHVDSILKGMAAINNTMNTLEADSVFHMYCIHIYQLPLSYLFYSSAPHSLDPGTPANDILRRHGCYFGASTSSGFEIKCDHYINFRALADSVSIYASLTPVGPGLIIGGGNYIEYTADASKIYHFHLEWGDCPAGCTVHKTWSYSVDPACNVTLDSVRSRGYDWEGPSHVRQTG